MNNRNKEIIPTSIVEYMEKTTNDLKKNGYEDKPLKIGDKIPGGEFINHFGKTVSLDELLNNKPAIINFYRGTWCPYCDLELSFYNELLEDITNKEVVMFAISPEKPDITMETRDIEKLNFNVLSDIDNKFAQKLKTIYENFEVDLKRSQGNEESVLPIPATYIIDGNKVITHAWIDADYTKRAEPTEVINAYKKLKGVKYDFRDIGKYETKQNYRSCS